MRKILVCALTAVLIFGTAGCGLDISKDDVNSIAGLFTEDSDKDST